MASELAGFGLKERAWNDRALVGLWRERWAEMANARLAELGHDVRIDHRSHAARGLELQPQNKIGPAAARRARKGEDGDRTAEHRAIARANGERLLAEPELALRALTHQHSTFTRADLARLVHRQSDGATQFATIMAKVEASPELVRVGSDGRGRDRFSTAELVQVEARMIATAAALDKRTTHPVPMARRTEAAIGTTLREEQHLAFQHVTRSRDLAVVVGIAGGGKSTMLGVARAAWKAESYRVKGAALSGIAAEGLEGSSGIESRTIASWEYAWDKGKEQLAAGDVLVVDEAGMIGSRQLERLCGACTRPAPSWCWWATPSSCRRSRPARRSGPSPTRSAWSRSLTRSASTWRGCARRPRSWQPAAPPLRWRATRRAAPCTGTTRESGRPVAERGGTGNAPGSRRARAGPRAADRGGGSGRSPWATGSTS